MDGESGCLLLTVLVVTLKMTQFEKFFRNPSLLPAIRGLSSCRDVKWEDAKPYESIPGPKPPPIPNFGNYWRFAKLGPYGNLELEQMMMRLKEEFGDIIRMTGIGQEDMVFLCDQLCVEKMFRHELKTPVRHTVERFKYYQEKHRPDVFSTSLGIGMLQGEEWLATRSALNPILMQPNNVKPYLTKVETVADEFIERMRELRDGKLEMPQFFADELAKWSVESLAFIFLDTRLGFLANEKSEEALRLINANQSFELSFHLDFMPSFWKYVSTPAWRKFVKNMDIITDFTYDCAIRKCEEIEKGSNSEGNEPRSLLEAMIRSKSVEFAVVAGTDLVSAGVDTVSSAVGTMLSHLATHPEKQQKLFEELKSVLPDKNTPLTDVALSDLKYLKAALKESLRLRPVSPGNSRTTATNLVLGGYKIPKGTKLLSLGSIISVDDRYFKQPEKFVPERWLKSEEKTELSVTNSSAFANTPFGFGPRMCIGRRFADLQMQTLTAKIIRKFEVSYDYGDMEWRLPLFLKPIKPLKFRITDRTELTNEKLWLPEMKNKDEKIFFFLAGGLVRQVKA